MKSDCTAVDAKLNKQSINGRGSGMKTIDAIATVNPEGKLTIELASDLPPGTHRAVVVIDDALLAQPATPDEQSLAHSVETKTAWTVLRDHAGSVEMPEDWSREHDHYLYGTPKRES